MTVQREGSNARAYLFNPASAILESMWNLNRELTSGDLGNPVGTQQRVGFDYESHVCTCCPTVRCGLGMDGQASRTAAMTGC